MQNDFDFLKKLPTYKTAYSKLFDTYISINRVYYDDNNRPIIVGIMEGKEHLFRVEELQDFVL